jgi:hypothetical protein
MSPAGDPTVWAMGHSVLVENRLGRSNSQLPPTCDLSVRKTVGLRRAVDAAYKVLRPFYDERYREAFASVGGLCESVLGLAATG